MQRHKRKVMTAGVLALVLAGALIFLFIGPPSAAACGAGACGWTGQSGGADFVPQRQTGGTGLAAKSALTREQAREIVTNHIHKLNPSLKVGKINDSGGFYEADVLSRDDEVIQVLGVDKYSGRLMTIN